MPATTAQRVRKRREALRAEGLRPKQMWVYDTSAPGFVEECRRQARVAAEADRKDPELMAFLDAAFEEFVKDIPA